MIRGFLKDSPRAISIIVGLACACITLEALRMPAVRSVTFEMHHPLPYLCEAVALVVLAMLFYRHHPARRLGSRASVVIAVGSLTCLSLFFITQDLTGNALEMFAVSSVYRVSSAFLFVIWCERLFELGARRGAMVLALSTVLGGAILLAFSLLNGLLAQAVIATFPVVSMGLLLAENQHAPERPEESGSTSTEDALDAPLPGLSFGTHKERLLALALLMLPLVARSPFISVQSSWMETQNGFWHSFLLQSTIAIGWIIGAALALFVVLKLWNKYCLAFYELATPLLGLVALYATQASTSLWFIYLPLIDASYRVVLLFVAIAPFLVRNPRSFGIMPLCLGCLIGARAACSLLFLVLPPEFYAGVSILIIVVCVLGGMFILFTSGFLSTSSSADRLQGENEDVLSEACQAIANEKGLTSRESEILVLLAKHYNAPYIAKKLVLSVSTVKTHMRNLYAKLEVHSQADLLILVEEAVRNIESQR